MFRRKLTVESNGNYGPLRRNSEEYTAGSYAVYNLLQPRRSGMIDWWCCI